MSCDICAKPFKGSRKPTCVSCAQAALYGSRVQHVFSALDREKAHTHGEAIFRPGNDGVLAALAEDADWDTITGGIQKLGVERKHGELEASRQRITAISEQAANLRRQMEEYREYAAEQTVRHEQRRQRMTAEAKALGDRKKTSLDSIGVTNRTMNRSLNKTHRRVMDARAYLCKEAATLGGLKHRMCKTKDGRTENDYMLGGTSIPNLKRLNNIDHQSVSASLDSICRLLCLCCHYLSVRLPCEILPPHNDFPHAVILPAEKSYQSVDVAFPSTASGHSPSPSASSTLDQKSLPRPRLLHLDRPLPKLAKEDPKMYGLFVEGVTLLAWDIAWLCKSQGVDTINTLDDLCAIGKNLWQLLLGPAMTTAVARPRLDREVSTANDTTSRKDRPKTPQSGAQLGEYSHGSAHRSLSGVEGTGIFQGWKLASSQRLVDRLKSHLQAEMSGAEWEVLEEREWNEDREDEEAVLVGGTRPSPDARHPGMSIMTVAHDDGFGDGPEPSSLSSNRGASGWTKLRGRDHEE
ncbi:hypothetical protein MBLNU230_g4396t1 [Neophaeotheca triangularis]